MRQIFPSAVEVQDELAIYDDVVFPEPPDERAYLYVNMVTSVDGRAQVSGRAAGLGSRTDQALMRRLRARADCVVNGAGTFNAEEVYAPLHDRLAASRRDRGQSSQPLWAVVTASGELRRDAKFWSMTGARPIAIIAGSTPADRREWLSQRADVVVAGDERPDPRQVLTLLRQRYGCRHVLCEGGPTLNYSLLRADVLDEMFLTLAPKVVGGDGLAAISGSSIPAAEWPRLRLVTLFEHADELFFRYRIERG